MEPIKATVDRLEDKHFIKIQSKGEDIIIPMSEDNPLEVKGAFNKIITKLKEGEFQIEFEAIGEDLFSQVANEYITQLNREIKEVYNEMKQYGLVQQLTE